MSAAAQRDEPPVLEAAPAGNALRQLAAERLAAHRNRRAAVQAQPEESAVRAAQAAVRLQARRDAAASHTARPNVRDAVAARYQQTPSYQEFLAAEAERALQKARAEAEVAARNAVAVAEAQRLLLAEIELWNQPPEPLFLVDTPAQAEAPSPASGTWDPPSANARPRRQRTPEPVYAEAIAPADLKIQLYADLPAATPVAAPVPVRHVPHEAMEELAELDQEIAFRLAPEFQDHHVETLPIQANIIEFPRQLVASRKARPRLAEGPLREDGTPEPQLRIFEVEPEQVSTEPEMAPTAAPDWQSMLLSPVPASDSRLDALDSATYTVAQQDFDTAHNIALQVAPQLHTAPILRRVMAMAVDAVCVGAGFVAFAAVAARLCGPALHQLPLPELAAVAAIALAVFATLYQVLFFTLSEATPGMRYARLGLCTFGDANPSRRAIRRRLAATAVAVCPLGLGLLWMALDPDRLAWHDRISRMYPRAY
jgi:uncharacterized RDD family membrane protein YckC